MLEKYLAGVVVFLIAIAVLALIRAFWGPSAVDRIIAMNIITTEIIMIILIYAYLHHNINYIDVGLVFTLGSFIATLSMLKLLSKDRLEKKS
ncbi:MAG: hypothetical protein GX887_05680 [Firmicutes bacterium]|nr:hypothetical protein [Bacillota bacterium]